MLTETAALDVPIFWRDFSPEKEEIGDNEYLYYS